MGTIGSKKHKGFEIKIARLRAGLKQYELAAKIGIGPTQLCEIELGRREVTTELLAHISCVIESCGRQITKE